MMEYRIVEHGLFGRSMVIWWKVPVFWRWISWARVPTVYLRKSADEFTLVEEEVHVVQVYKDGAFQWIIGHLFDKEYRLSREVPAKAARMKAKVDSGGYSLPELIVYNAASLLKSYRLGTRWTAEEIEEKLLQAYMRI
jgi:hypothetical protein